MVRESSTSDIHNNYGVWFFFLQSYKKASFSDFDIVFLEVHSNHVTCSQIHLGLFWSVNIKSSFWNALEETLSIKVKICTRPLYHFFFFNFLNRPNDSSINRKIQSKMANALAVGHDSSCISTKTLSYAVKAIFVSSILNEIQKKHEWKGFVMMLGSGHFVYHRGDAEIRRILAFSR